MPRKDPNANLDFAADWADWLAKVGDTAVSFAWSVPAGLVKTAEGVADGVTKTNQVVPGARAVVWLSGGTNGTVYPVTCSITTAAGRTDDFTFTVSVKSR